jgi:hypothetical protein
LPWWSANREPQRNQQRGQKANQAIKTGHLHEHKGADEPSRSSAKG